MTTQPRFSLIAALDDGAPRQRGAEIQRALRSVLAQTCRSWELLVPDRVDGDVLGDRRVRAVLPAADPITAASAGLAVAHGEFVGVLEPGGWLDRDALAAVNHAIGATGDVDHVYTDEVLHGEGTTVVMRKPDWSPERQRGQDYCGQLSLYRRSLADEVGGLRPSLGAAARHDLSLRVAERARRTVHVPAALHHRTVEAATADEVETMLRAIDLDAVRQHLERQSVVADIRARGSSCAIRRRAGIAPVSVVVPTAGSSAEVWGIDQPLVVGALQSLLDVTDHPRYEVVVVVDPVTPPAVRAAISALPVVLVDGVGPFDFAARCNAGVAASAGDHVVLLNDDVLIEQPDWLTAMVGHLADPGVGIVGARLLYADGTLQHAGILLNEHPRHIFAGFAGDDPGPFDLLRVAREVSAVTGACLATTRVLWDELGGLSSDFAVAFNDIDYCLRAAAAGRRTVWTPEATLYHFESQTRQPPASRDEVERLEARWGHVLRRDPYGSPGFEPGQASWIERQRPGATDLVRRASATWRRHRQRAS
ncbi:MAG: glycosyltransferase [Ilumatobacteraceae bacterium]